MFYLLFAIITSSIIFVLFKMFSTFKIDVFQAVTVNYVIASLLGYLSSPERITFPQVFSNDWFPYAVISGVFLMATFYIYGISTQKVGIAITSVSGKMSVVIPVLVGFVWFKEDFNWIRISGIILAMAAFYFTLMRSNSQKAEGRYLILPILLFFGNGFNDSIFKISQELYINGAYINFLTVAFSVSLLAGLIIMIPRTIITKSKILPRNILAGIILGLFNWFSTYFFLVGLSRFDVSVFIPVFNVSIVAIAAIIGYLFYREKLSTINIIGIALAIASIVVIAGLGF
jgi:drug/metabolite transporter (DMT)-like permease